MFDREKLNDVLKHYKRDFVSFIWNDKDYKRWKEEQYKWIAVQWFRDHWDVKAVGFPEMLKNALSKTSNLLVSVNNFPRGMIEGFAKSSPEEVRAMFIELYDESKDVYERINAFKQQSAVMLEKYGGDAKQHYQYENAISTYLWLEYPDKYYIYKYSVVKKVAEILGADYQFKQGAYAENIRNFLKLYDEICDALKEDTELVELFRSNRSDSCYPDPELKTLTVDFVFYIANFYEDRISQENDSSGVDEEEIDDKETEDEAASFESTVNAWLLAWNPKNYDWENVEEEFSLDTMFTKVKSGGGFYDQWRCMSSKIKCGDLLYVMKLGTEPKGIFVSGYAISDSYIDDDTRIVDVLFTKTIDFRIDEIISQDILKEKFPDQQWSPQGSGIAIKPDAARWLINYWNRSFETHSTDADYLDKIEPQREPVIWKIGHGTNSTGIPEHLRSVFEERKVVVIHQGTARLAVQSESQGQAYMLEIKKGDFFYLCYAGEIVLFGQFTDDIPKLNYEMVNEWNDYDWYERPYRLIARSKDHNKYTGVKKVWTSNYNSTCVKVTDNALFEELILEPYFGLKIADLSTAEYHEPYSSEDFLSEVFMTEERYNALTGVLQNKLNIILQGAPGVGKTFAARRLAWSMMGEKDDSRIEFVQFHQNYSYEDFMMGYKPAGDSFELKYGIFYRFCQKAANQPDKPFFFIIDEINRGNMSKIFGELLMLIEKDYRGSKATLAYNGMQFSVPKNLYIIGMMNTADRSLAMIDYALRRRFSFFDVEPGFDSQGFIEYQNSLKNDTLNALIATVKELNNDIASDKSLGKGFCIGHSYFCGRKDCTEEWLRAVVNYDILPMLCEYWFDETNKLQTWENRLQGVFQS